MRKIMDEYGAVTPIPKRTRLVCLLLATLCLHLSAPSAHAQEADTVIYPVWENELAGRFSASQVGFQNWAEGGVNSLSAKSLISGEFVRKSVEWTHTYETRFAFGIVKQDTLNLRKSEDVIRLAGTVNYAGDGFLQKYTPTVALALRTQFAPGYKFEKNPFEGDDSLPVKVSDFFSPATITQTIGLEYGSKWGFKQRLGIAAKETVVFIDRFAPLYGLQPGENVRFQLGVESKSQVDKEIFTNVKLSSALGLFAAFNQEELPDILWENLIVMQVNKWLSADFEVVTLYDRDISDDLQLKEALSVGISIVFI